MYIRTLTYERFTMNIVKIDKKYVGQLAQIDYDSEHQNSSLHVSQEEMELGLQKRFQGHELFFGYMKDNELVGYATLKPFFPGYKHCEMYWLAVRKESQGQGIGSDLVKFVEGYARDQGFRRIFVYTGKNMNLTRRFYEKNGYDLVNEFPKYYGYPSGNTTAVLYGKWLEKE
jgi:ribosomal protein S18 acetylase RimI-like enzyme